MPNRARSDTRPSASTRDCERDLLECVFVTRLPRFDELPVVSNSSGSGCWEVGSERDGDQIAREDAREIPNDQVLRWAASAVGGTSVVSSESLGRGGHRASGTFRLRIEGPAARATDVILKVPVPGWISAAWVITNAQPFSWPSPWPGRAAADRRRSRREGERTVATLETFLSGSTDLPPTASVARLREGGAALARVHAFRMEAQAHLPSPPPAVRRRRPRRRTAAGPDADHTSTAAGRQAG